MKRQLQIRFTKLAGDNAVLGGLFFGGTRPSTSATFVGSDTTTQGNWIGAFGAAGYSVVNDATSLPAWATITPSGQNAFTWASTAWSTTVYAA